MKRSFRGSSVRQRHSPCEPRTLTPAPFLSNGQGKGPSGIIPLIKSLLPVACPPPPPIWSLEVLHPMGLDILCVSGRAQPSCSGRHLGMRQVSESAGHRMTVTGGHSRLLHSPPQAAGAPPGHHQGHSAHAVFCSQEEIPGESYTKPFCPGPGAGAPLPPTAKPTRPAYPATPWT